MPNRIIRESLLDSSRYWDISQDARQFFIHLLLLADDLACVSLAPVMLRRRAFDAPPSDQKLAKLLAELVDAGLLRLYSWEGRDYAFIPRFRQRVWRETFKNPPPPDELLSDEKELLKIINEIKRKTGKYTVPAQSEHRASNKMLMLGGYKEDVAVDVGPLKGEATVAAEQNQRLCIKCGKTANLHVQGAYYCKAHAP